MSIMIVLMFVQKPIVHIVVDETREDPTHKQTTNQLGMNVLSANPYDIPFAGYYLLSNNADRTTSLTLASSYGLSTSSNAHRVLPSRVSLAGSLEQQQQEDPITQVIRITHQTKEHQILDISSYGIGAIPPWNDEPRYAVVLPLTTNNRASSSYCSTNNGTNSNSSSASSSTDGVDSDVVDTFGVLVVGVNSRRELDDPYLTFFKLVAAQTTGSLNTAHRHEEAKKKADALAELDRAKTLFFTNISHELRTYDRLLSFFLTTKTPLSYLILSHQILSSHLISPLILSHLILSPLKEGLIFTITAN